MNLQKKSSQESDIKFPNPPNDGISSMSVNGSMTQPTNMLIATCWDNSVNCYEIQSNGQGVVTNILLQGQTKHDAPALCSDISTDNVTVFSGGCDGAVRMWNVTQGPTASQVIGKHDGPVKNVKFAAESNVVITSSWDKSMRVWDMRQPNPAANIALSDRVYAMDSKQKAVVLGTADKLIHVFDMTAGRKIAEYKSPLSYQTRCISLFHDNKGFAMGCIEGRIALEYFDELHTKNQSLSGTAKPATKNFVYKCHRDGNDIFSVNSIHFHNKNTYCSVGSDGVLSFWDKEARHRLSHLEQFKRQCPITDVKFNAAGNWMFYSMSYDWSRGAENNDPKMGNNIMLHQVQAIEITPKDPKTLGKK